MLKWRHLLSLFILLSVMMWQTYAQSIKLDHTTKQIQLDQHALFLLDEDNQYRIEDILSDDPQLSFSKKPSPFGSKYNKSLWLKFNIQSTIKEGRYWIIEFQPSSLSHVDAYLVDQHKKIISSYTYRGDIPFSQQPTYYRNPIIKIYIESETQPTLYLNINNDYGTVREITMWAPYAFIENSAKQQLLWGCIFGIYAILILVSWWFERAVKDGIYGAFALYVMICAFIDLQIGGWWKQLFFPAKTTSSLALLEITYVWLTFLAANFFFRYVEVKKTKPVISSLILKVIFIYCFIYSLIILSVNTYELIRIHGFINTFIILPVCLWLLWLPAWRSRSEIRRTFFYISLIFIGSYIYSTLGLLGFYQRNTMNVSATTLAGMLVFVLIYYSLSKKYQRMREEKEKANEDILAFIQNSENYLKEQVTLKTQHLVETQKKLELSLEKERESYRDQRNFIAMISHELRTPLSVINASVQNLLRNKQLVAAGIINKLDKIHIAAQRLSALITDYLNNDRMDAFSQQVEPDWVMLSPLFDDAVMMAQLVSAKQKYMIDLKDPSYKIWADEDLLKLVIRTLAENAAKYTPEDTEIHLYVRESVQGWIISVRDNGPGIPDDEKSHIFDRYYRGKSSVKQVGTGLGLSLAKHLVELQHGQLTLEDSPGQGATFNVFLPHPDVVPIST